MPLPSIQEEGGLRIHLSRRSIDYDIFINQLTAKTSYRAIADYWTEHRREAGIDKPNVNARIIGKWKRYYIEHGREAADMRNTIE